MVMRVYDVKKNGVVECGWLSVLFLQAECTLNSSSWPSLAGHRAGGEVPHPTNHGRVPTSAPTCQWPNILVLWNPAESGRTSVVAHDELMYEGRPLPSRSARCAVTVVGPVPQIQQPMSTERKTQVSIHNDG